MSELYGCALSTLGPVVLMVCVTPVALLGVVPVLYIYYGIFNYFRRTSRELKRLEANSRSPIYAHLTESLHGVACLRALQLVDHFKEDSMARIDALNRVFWPMISCNRWLGLRLELCGNLLITSAALAAVLARWSGNVDHHYAALLGLSITFALSITNELVLPCVSNTHTHTLSLSLSLFPCDARMLSISLTLCLCLSPSLSLPPAPSRGGWCGSRQRPKPT